MATLYVFLKLVLHIFNSSLEIQFLLIVINHNHILHLLFVNHYYYNSILDWKFLYVLFSGSTLKIVCGIEDISSFTAERLPSTSRRIIFLHFPLHEFRYPFRDNTFLGLDGYLSPESPEKITPLDFY